MNSFFLPGMGDVHASEQHVYLEAAVALQEHGKREACTNFTYDSINFSPKPMIKKDTCEFFCKAFKLVKSSREWAKSTRYVVLHKSHHNECMIVFLHSSYCD